MDIKKCPFCGGSARIYAYDPFDGYQGNLITYRVECTKCWASVKDSNENKAIEAWNRRVDDGRED